MIIYNQFGLFTMPVANIKILEKFEIIFEGKYIYIYNIDTLIGSFIHSSFNKNLFGKYECCVMN